MENSLTTSRKHYWDHWVKSMAWTLSLDHFRPVSNLTFLSKLIEHVAAVQLMDMAQQTGNYEELQSAYWNHHSTEMALLKVKTDILENMDNGRVNFLMLDLSAAFDMISLDFLTNRLQHRFGMNRNCTNLDNQLFERMCPESCSKQDSFRSG